MNLVTLGTGCQAKCDVCSCRMLVVCLWLPTMVPSCPIGGCLFRVSSVAARARRRPSASVTPYACPASHNALRLHRCPLFNNSFLIINDRFLPEDTVQCFMKIEL